MMKEMLKTLTFDISCSVPIERVPAGTHKFSLRASENVLEN